MKSLHQDYVDCSFEATASSRFPFLKQFFEPGEQQSNQPELSLSSHESNKVIGNTETVQLEEYDDFELQSGPRNKIEMVDLETPAK